MSVTARSFAVPKRGNSADEYEDACAANPESGRFAVADGATESIFARFWAELLVEHFVSKSTGGAGSWLEWLPDVQQRWRDHFEGRVLQYYVEEKLSEGSFAAFLGLVFGGTQNSDGDASPADRLWSAAAVGDCCLFQTRDSALCSAFPFRSSEEFNNHPVLLGSRTPSDVVESKRAIISTGTARTADRLWMMSDALAHWFLQEWEADAAPWSQLDRILSVVDSAGAFRDWIEVLRDERRIRNDDVTLVAILV